MNMRKRLSAGIILGVCASGLGLGSISADAATTGANAASSATAASTPDHGCWNGCGGGGWGGGGRGGWGGGYSCHRWYGWGPGPYGPYYGMHRHCERHGGGGWDDGGGDGRDEG